MWAFSFVVPDGTSYFPLGPPLRGKFALRAVAVARLFRRAFTASRILLLGDIFAHVGVGLDVLHFVVIHDT